MTEPNWVALGQAAVTIDYVGVWSGATSYKAGDIVVHNGVQYLAVNPSTNQTPPGASVVGIPASLLDAKGDLIVGSADNTAARLAAGTSGHLLTADSVDGVKWAAPPTPVTPGMTLIQDIIASGSVASVTFSAIPATFKHLQIVWDSIINGATDLDLFLRMNGDTTANYDYQLQQGLVSAVSTSGSNAQVSAWVGVIAGLVTNCRSAGVIEIPYYLNTMRRSILSRGGAYGSAGLRVFSSFGQWRGTAPVTSLTVLINSSSFYASGRFTLYGLA